MWRISCFYTDNSRANSLKGASHRFKETPPYSNSRLKLPKQPIKNWHHKYRKPPCPGPLFPPSRFGQRDGRSVGVSSVFRFFCTINPQKERGTAHKPDKKNIWKIKNVYGSKHFSCVLRIRICAVIKWLFLLERLWSSCQISLGKCDCFSVHVCFSASFWKPGSTPKCW